MRLHAIRLTPNDVGFGKVLLLMSLYMLVFPKPVRLST